MLIHITPRFLTCAVSGPDCHLADLQIPEFGLHLEGGRDLVSRRPYPNKHYLVASRKTGQRLIDGILIETDVRVDEFTVMARWAVHAERVVTHRVRYILTDNEHDTVSDMMVLWGNWRARKGLGAHYMTVPPDWTPSTLQPRMDLTLGHTRKGEIVDYRIDGLVVERNETFRLPTIDRARLESLRQVFDRLPTPASAFMVAA